MIPEILIGLLASFAFYLFKRKKTDGLPPGEWGLPIIGSLPSKSVLMYDYIEKYKKEHGKIFTWKMGSRTFVFVCDYKILKTAFNNPLLIDRPRFFSFDFFSDFKRLGYVNTNGQRWQNLRRFSVRYLRDNGMGKTTLEDTINFETECLIKDLKKMTGTTIPEIPWSINVAVLNVLWGIMASQRFDVDDQKFQNFEKLITDLFLDTNSTIYLIYDLFPCLSKLLPNSWKRYFGMANGFRSLEEYKKFLMAAIDEHKKTLEIDNPRDFIDYYLIEMKNNAEENVSNEATATFSNEDLLYTLSDILHPETTSTTIKWIIVYMIKYPEVQKRIQKLIDEFVPRDRLPSLQDKEKLAYAEATYYEVLRMKNVLPLGTYHCARNDTTIEKFKIPKGTIIVSPIETLHYDDEYWEKPLLFHPERFLLPNGTIDSKKEGFLPFSIGRRVCPGEPLARMELFLFATALLQKFTFSSPEGVDEIIKPDPSVSVIIQPKPFKLNITERY